MAADRYALEFIANVESYQRRLAQIPGYTDSKAATAAERMATRFARAQIEIVQDAERAAARAAASWRTAGEDAAKGFGNGFAERLDVVEDKTGRVDQALAGLAGALDQVNPRLGELARMGGDAAGGLEAVLRLVKLSPAGLLALGLAAVTAGGAYLKLSDDLEEAEARQERAAAAASTLQTAMEGLEEVVSSIDDEYRILTGEIDQFGLALEQRQAAITKEFAESRAGLEALLAQERQQVELLRQQAAAGKNVESDLAARRRSIGTLLAALEQSRKSEEQTLQRAADLAEVQRETAESAEYLARRERDLAEAHRVAAQRAAEQRQRLADLRAEVSDFLAFAVEAQSELDFSRGLADMLPTDRVVDPQAVEAMRGLQDRLDELVPPDTLDEVDQLRQLLYDLELQAYSSSESMWAMGEPIAQVRDRLAELEQSELASAMAEQRQATQAFTTGMMASLQGMGDSLVTIMQNSGERGVGIAHGLAKGMATAQVIFSTAQAVMAAFQPPPIGAGPILGGALATAMGINGALQIAAINSAPNPTVAHSGQVFSDETMVRAQAGERIISRAARAGGGDAVIDALERGRSPAGMGPAVLELRDGHRVIGRAVARNMRRASTRAQIQDAARTPGGWR